MASNGSANGGPKRERLALLLASGRTVRSAARIAGVSQRTAYRWHAEDQEFQSLVAQLRAGMVQRGVAVLSGAMGKAAARLRKLIGSEDHRVALGACRAVLELRTKLHESEELDKRLAALERRGRK